MEKAGVNITHDRFEFSQLIRWDAEISVICRII
jgi:hypothetical protein